MVALTIPAGQRSAELWVRVKGYDTFEPNETVNLAITGLSGGAALGVQSNKFGVIRNDDPKPAA